MRGFLLAAVGMVCAHAVFSAENLVINPGFDRVDAKGRTVAWSDRPPVFRFLDGAGENGSRGLVFENTDPKAYFLISQKIDAKPGRCYRFSAKIRTHKLTGSSQGARICMEWADASGKWIGGAYAGLSRADTKGEWVLLEGTSDPIPTNAARVTFTLLADHGTTGKAFFDNVRVARYFPPAVSAVVLSGYRGEYDGGILRAHVALKLTARDMNSDNGSVLFKILDAENRIVRKAAPLRFDNKAAYWETNTDTLPPGRYRLVCTVTSHETKQPIGEGSARFTRVTRKTARKVTVDAHNRLIVDGKPFFPLGMYWSRINKEEMDIFAKGPFNCLMAYQSPTTEELDLCKSNGIRVLYSIKDIFAGSNWARVKKAEDEEPLIRGIVSMHKDHPALLGWYLNDELPLVPFRPRLEAHQRLLEDIDPDHPTWVVIYQDPNGYQQTCDVLGIDHYPVPTAPCGKMLKKTRLCVSRTFGERPIWMVPQAMDWGVYHTGDRAKKARFPTPLEMRSMAWQCIAGGANGLLFYSFFDLRKKTAKLPFETTWPQTCAAAAEIRRYSPVLLSNEPVPSVTHNGPESLAVRVHRYNGALYVLAVNSSDHPVSATLVFDEKIGSVTSEFGPAATRTDDNRLTCSWAPLEPALFVIRQP